MSAFCLHNSQNKLWFLCIFLFTSAILVAFGDVIQEQSKSKVLQEVLGKNIQNPDAIQDGYDEETFSLEGKTPYRRNVVERISKRSAYDFEGPLLNRGFVPWERGNYPNNPFQGYKRGTPDDPTASWGEKTKKSQATGQNGDPPNYPEDSYWTHFSERERHPEDDTYMTSVYMPHHHFFGAFKRSFSPRYLEGRPSYRRLFMEKDARDLKDENFQPNFEDFSSSKRKKRHIDEMNDRKPYKMAAGDIYSIDPSLNDFKDKRSQIPQKYNGDTLVAGWRPISMRKRHSESKMVAGYHGGSGNDPLSFHGDILKNVSGDFYPMKKSEVDSRSFGRNVSPGGLESFQIREKRGIPSNLIPYFERDKRGDPRQRSEIIYKRFYSNSF